jgi:type IV secretory pathway VirB2 component (pilin)
MFTFCIINIAHAGVISDAPTFEQIGMNILNFLLSVAGIVAIIALVLSGIMYFFSAGDERKMEVAKKSALYAILGIVLIMGSMVLVRLIGGFLN